MTLTPEEQAALAGATAPAPAQDPPVTEAPAAVQPAPAPAPVAPSQGSPWDADLASAFEDEATRQAVSEFLGQKVQPHVTRVEQSGKAGRELLDALNADPDGTMRELIEAVYDEDTAKAIIAAASAEVEPVQHEPADGFERDPEVQRLIDKAQEEEDRAAFVAEFDRVKAANPDVDLDFDLFVPFVAKAGDFDQAVIDYAAYLARFREQAGTPAAGTAEAGAEGDVTRVAPATLGGGQAAGVGAAPTEKEYNGDLGAAIEDFMAEERIKGGSLAPPVPG